MAQNSINQNTSTGSVLTQSVSPWNSGFGAGSILSTATGIGNVGVGYQALGAVTTGLGNLGVGYQALSTITTGQYNVGLGVQALKVCTGSQNTAVGAGCMLAVTTGSNNTAIGENALSTLSTGSYNCCFGFSAGQTYTGGESNNIVIGYNVPITPGESNVLRIGSGMTACVISGIAGVTVANQQMVTVNSSTGQLGSAAITSIIWSAASSATTISLGNGYYANNASTAVAFTLPATPTAGGTFKIAGVGAAGWSIGQTGSQTIIYGNKSTTAGSSGSLASSAIGDSVEILYTGSNTFIVLNSVGNLTII
jgi:hypothetical protein